VIVSAQQIKDDAARKTAIKSAFDLKRAAEEKAKAPDTSRPGVVIPGPTPGAGLTRPDQLNLRPGTREDDPERKKQAELEPFLDPLFPGENVLNDWAITVVVAVVLDPKPPAAAAAAGTATAEVGPADRSRVSTAAR
jgi:hypothetical protein